MSAEKAGTLRFSRPADWRYGFTLAETLIALVVIGIVAALTVPNIVEEYQKHQTVSGLKKIYSELNQAVEYAKIEYGDLSNWDFTLSNYDFFKTYLKRYTVLSEKTKSETGLVYKTSSGNVESGLMVMRANAVVLELSNGMLVFTSKYPTQDEMQRRRLYAFDINGYKNPNRFGKDTFMLVVADEKVQVLPFKYSDTSATANTNYTREQLINGIGNYYNYGCNKETGRGMWCAALIMADGWQISDDYPW